MIARRVLVTGRVQNVFYRASCAEQAAAEGVHGWVRNLPDGRVEACFEGTRDAVDRMVAWCHQGPPSARVSAVEVHEVEPTGTDSFEVR